MKPNFNNFVGKVHVVHTKEEVNNWIKECYNQYTWSQKIRVWLFNKLFKNKICKL